MTPDTTIKTFESILSETRICADCNGAGYKGKLSCGICRQRCPYCHGSGRVPTQVAREARERLNAAAPALYEAAKKAANELSVMLALNPARDGGLYREALDALNAALALVDTPTGQE